MEQQAGTTATAASDEALGRRRLPPEERRDELLDAALAAFSELGYDRATLNDVADRLGVTKGCLYHYFDSKEELLLELVRERMLRDALAEAEWIETAGGSREEILRRVIGRIWERLHEPGQIELVALMVEVLPKVPEVGRLLFDDVCSPKRRALRRALARDQEGPESAPAEIHAAEIHAAAEIIPYMLIGVALCHHLFREWEPIALEPERVGEVVTALLLRGIDGACPSAESGAA